MNSPLALLFHCFFGSKVPVSYGFSGCQPPPQKKAAWSGAVKSDDPRVA
tara:strand:- start:73 stop:219 length:147 start_codon:yes stop_codon:yes gene_type:complete